MSKESITVWHNNRCSKSREVCSLLENKDVEIREYLKNPPSEEEVREVLQKLDLPAEKLVRKNESLYKENFADKSFTNDQWIKVLAENPILIERPIVIKGNKAVIGRPAERIAEIVGSWDWSRE